MRVTIGAKIFGIAVGLLLLMSAVAGLSMRMTRTVDAQLIVLDKYYFPAYVRLASCPQCSGRRRYSSAISSPR